MLVRQAKKLAGELKGNKLRPEIVDMIGKILDTQDPAAIDAIDPGNTVNQKHLSQKARDNLRRAWEAIEKSNSQS